MSKLNQGRSAPLRLLHNVRDPALALAAAVVIVAVIIAAMGSDPIRAYSVLISTSVTTASGWGETLQKASFIIFSALSFAIAKRSGMINLGAAGQIYIGGILGSLAATGLEGLPAAVHIPLVLLCGILGGALYGSLAALLKNWFGASEIVTTMMLNYIAEHFCTYLISGPMKDPATDLAQSAPALETAKLPILLSGTRLHAGFLIAIAAIVLYFFLMERTTRGYQMKVVGMNPNVGAYAGLKIKTNQFFAMALAGGMAGLGGAIQATVIDVRMTIGWVGDAGFDGLSAAFLGGMTPVGIFAASVFFGILLSGATRMQMLAGVPSSVVYLFQGIVILMIVGREIFDYFNLRERLAKRRDRAKNEAQLAREKLVILNDAAERVPGARTPTEEEKAAAAAQTAARAAAAAAALERRQTQNNEEDRT